MPRSCLVLFGGLRGGFCMSAIPRLSFFPLTSSDRRLRQLSIYGTSSIWSGEV